MCVDLFSDEVSFLNWFVLIVLCCVICRWFGNWLLVADLLCCVFNSVAFTLSYRRCIYCFCVVYCMG